MTELRSHLTYANVMATGAMFLALGGGAYALSAAPDGSGVFHGCVSKKTGVLRVAASGRSCRGARKRHGRVVDPGEFAIAWNEHGQPGPQGIQGVQGVQGDPGRSGATNVVARTAFATSTDRVTASCLPGERATGGGGSTTVGALMSSFPEPASSDPFVPTGWKVVRDVSSSTLIQAWVLCASP